MRGRLVLGWSIILAAALILSAGLISSAPAGVTFTYNATFNFTPAPAASLTTAGGSFTTMNLNISGQTPRWKAYVGNVTGTITLDDASGRSVYDWTPSVISGEVFATRNASPSWTALACADRTNIVNEDTALNISSARQDSINGTFLNQSHRGFYVGTVQVPESSCYAIATYVNDTRQQVSESALFQEAALYDGAGIIFATILENHKWGFNRQQYDFQMILPNDEFATGPTTYYFFAEIG